MLSISCITLEYNGKSGRGGRIETDFLDAIGIEDHSGFQFVDGRTNPALTEEALSLILAINKVAKDGALSSRVSDAMMLAQDDVSGTPVRFPCVLLDEAAKEFEDDVAYLRSKFGLSHLSAYTDKIVAGKDGEAAVAYVDLCAAVLRHMAAR